MRLRSLLAVAALAAGLAWGGAVRAQQLANVARGAGPGATVQTHQLDAVNLFNGNLLLRIPLGITYPVNGQLSYQLGLTYNNNVWDHTQVEGPNGNQLTQSLPSRTSNAGLGWMLSLGRFLPRSATDADLNRNAYMSPDGSLHHFYPTLHEGETATSGIEYSRDGSYLRYRAATREVELPDSTVHRFNANGYPIERFRDRFGNAVTIDYGVANQWRINDPHGRQQRIYFRSDLAGMVVVDRVELTGFNGTTATYAFEYNRDAAGNPAALILTGCGNTDPATATRVAPMLTRIVLPDGSAYGMPISSYWGQASGVLCTTGMLKNVTLPTLGGLEWDYVNYRFPGESSNYSFAQARAGVGKRRTKSASGAVLGEWSYTTAITPPALPSNPQEELVNTVTDPLGHKVERFFSVYARTNLLTEARYEYGLPLSRKQAGDGAGRFLSSRVYGGGTTLVRSHYVAFEHDRAPGGAPNLQDRSRLNQRLVSQRTVFDDDLLPGPPAAKAYADVISSDFDGLGHYRSALANGNFESGNVRTTSVEFNAGNGTYRIDPATNLTAPDHDFVLVPPASPWILNDYSQTTASEGGVTEKSELCFNQTTGFLERERTYRSGTTASTADTVVLYSATAQGNVGSEAFHGGDGGNLPAGSLCGLSFGTPQYRLDSTYDRGSLKSSQWALPGVPNGYVSYKDVNRTIDASTGLTKTSLDSSGLLSTSYEYDAMGRVTAIRPAQDAWTSIYYPRATSSASLARVNVESYLNGTTTLLARRRTLLDSLGRAWREETLMPDAGWSTRETLYDGAGNRASISGADALSYTTRYQGYDPFGRPATIRPPDGNAHDVTLAYKGVRSVTRTAKVATSYNTATGTANETAGTKTELFDRLGRLTQVTEPNGAVTRYEYDVGARLTKVCQGVSGSSCVQQRTFTYDGRGFLTAEKHPELGTNGNATVSYLSFDSRGNPRRALDGSNDLSYTYDRAGRLTDIRETAGLQRPLKTFTYGDTAGNGTSDYRNGKLVQAERFNYQVVDGTGYTVDVIEKYAYGGRGGRTSRRDTTIRMNGSDNETFTTTFAFDDLGNVTSAGHPQCTFPACGSVTAPRTATYTYTKGFLTGVGGITGSVPNTAFGITYHPDGMTDRIAHANGVVVATARPANGMARPESMTATKGAATLWSSGTYQYDGSGNIWKIGTSWFEYDALSRIKTAAVFPDPSGGGVEQKQTYSYDNYANLLSIARQVGGGPAVARNTPTAAATNHLSGAGYDGSGNLTSWNGNSYEYDAFNQLRKYVSGAEEWYYMYNADDERIWSFKPERGATPRFDRWSLRDLDGNVLREWANSGYTFSSYQDYFRRGAVPLASILSNGEVRHFHVDHLGSPRLVTDAAGQQLNYHVYFPFGEEATPFQPATDRMKFTGHERDLASLTGANPTADDLDYLHARHYGPLIGRFLGPDRELGTPWQPQSWNRYSYALSSPMNVVDPDGNTGVAALPALVLQGGSGATVAGGASTGGAVATGGAAAGGAAVVVAGAAGWYVGTKIGEVEVGGATVNEHVQGAFTAILAFFSKQRGNVRDTGFEGISIEILKQWREQAAKNGDKQMVRRIDRHLKGERERNPGKARGDGREPKKPKQNKTGNALGPANANRLTTGDLDLLREASWYLNLDEERAAVCGVGMPCVF